ncbi:MAG TPA: DUF998 domain-containing protein [Mucilaginibacter sp.]|nr:DUF998 domain-containing protein [Mucilaginibacter sp.]
MLSRTLLSLGTGAVVLFWVSTIICGYIHGHYNHGRDTISELGALGSRSQYLFSWLLSFVALMGLGFSWGLLRVCRLTKMSPIPIVPIVVFFLANVGIAFYSLGDPMHPVVGQISEIIMLGPILVLVFWRGPANFGLRMFSMVALAFFILSLLLLLSGWLPDSYVQSHSGLLQRIFHAGWSFWLISLNISFNQKLK